MKTNAAPAIKAKHPVIKSSFLDREVQLTVLLPHSGEQKPYPVLWLNDGQDIPSVKLPEIISALYSADAIQQHYVVGIHADENRLQEYGTSYSADFKNRGARAGLFGEFVVNELMPYIRSEFSISRARSKNVFAGWSMGALSALDIVWNNPDLFSRVGVFSGSLWWRSRAYHRGYRDDKHRIIHQMIRHSEKREGLKFWFECGTRDETADRNKNGLIDSIDDTIDLIRELKLKGYTDNDIELVLVKDGEHNQETWSSILPWFLQWAFGINKNP